MLTYSNDILIDQPVHPGNQISALIVCSLENIRMKLAKCLFRRFYQVIGVKQAALRSAWS